MLSIACAAVISALLLPAPGLNSALIALIVLYALYLFRHYDKRRTKHAVKAVRYQNKQWWIKYKIDGWVKVSIKEPPLITPLLSIIIFKSERKRSIPVAIFYDSVDCDANRRLRIQLRLNG